MSPIGRSRTPESHSLTERIERLKAIVAHLKALAARSEVRRPGYRMLVARSLVYLLPGIGLLLIATQSYVFGGALIFITPFAAGLLLFYDVGQRGRMAYHVARYARGEPSDDPDGADAAISGKRGKLLLLGVVEWFERKLQRQDDDAGFLMKLIGAVVGELLDVAGAFLVPAVVLDDVTLEEGVQKVKDLRSHAPEAFLGSVGFDQAAALLSSIFWLPVIVIPILAVVGAATGVITPHQAAALGGVLAVLLAVPLALTQTLREAAKVAYFTAFYLLVAHPDEVAGERETSLQGLVEMTEPGEELTPVAGSGTAPGPGGAAGPPG